jgi:hypothetical protein
VYYFWGNMVRSSQLYPLYHRFKKDTPLHQHYVLFQSRKEINQKK